MEKVKLFFLSSYMCTEEAEEKINSWFSQNSNIKITDRVQTTLPAMAKSPPGVLISIYYFEGQ